MLEMEKSHISSGHVHKGKFDSTLNNCINRINGIENELNQVDKNLINLQRSKTSEVTTRYTETVSTTDDTDKANQHIVAISMEDTSDTGSNHSSPSFDRQNTSSPNIIIDKKKTVEQIQNQLFNKSNIKRTMSLGQKPTYKKQSSLVSTCLNKFENGIQETEPIPGENRQCSTLPRKWKTKSNGFIGKANHNKPPDSIHEKNSDNDKPKATSVSKIPVITSAQKQNVCNKENVNVDDKKLEQTVNPRPQLFRRNTFDTPSHNLQERLTKASSTPIALKSGLSLSLDRTDNNPFSLKVPQKTVNKPTENTSSNPSKPNENGLLETTTRRKLERSQSLTKFTPISPKAFKEISFQMKKPNDLAQRHSLQLNGSDGNETIHCANRNSYSDSNNIEIHLNGTKCKVDDDDSSVKTSSSEQENSNTITEDDFRNTSFIASMQSAKECRQRRKRASLEPSQQLAPHPAPLTSTQVCTQPNDICSQTNNIRRRPCSTGSMDKIIEVEENEDEATQARLMKTGSLEISDALLRGKMFNT